MSGVKLLPCPFCGSAAEIERVGDRSQSTIYQCTSCSCSLETGEEWDHGRRWNTRTTAQGLDAATIERVGHAIRPLIESDGEIYWASEYGRPVPQESIDAIASAAVAALNTASTTTRGEPARLREALEERHAIVNFLRGAGYYTKDDEFVKWGQHFSYVAYEIGNLIEAGWHLDKGCDDGSR